MIIAGILAVAVGLLLGFYIGMNQGVALCKLNHRQEGSDLGIMRYGYNRTWHRTHHITIEVHEGTVIAVWFRCMALPFEVQHCGKTRVQEMKTMYAEPDGPTSFKIHAVDVEFSHENKKGII